nr:protein mam3 [Quercus suber]
MRAEDEVPGYHSRFIEDFTFVVLKYQTFTILNTTFRFAKVPFYAMAIINGVPNDSYLQNTKLHSATRYLPYYYLHEDRQWDCLYVRPAGRPAEAGTVSVIERTFGQHERRRIMSEHADEKYLVRQTDRAPSRRNGPYLMTTESGRRSKRSDSCIGASALLTQHSSTTTHYRRHIQALSTQRTGARLRMSRWQGSSHARHHGSPSVVRGSSGGRGFGAVRPIVLAMAKLVAIPLASAMPLSLNPRGLGIMEEDAPKDADDPNLWIYLGVALALVLLGGAFAGLTIALMGQDETYLQVIASSGEGHEKKHANAVLRLLKRGKHWVLVTLLLSNVITNETLPIVLDRSLGGGWPAVLGSTVAIGEFREASMRGTGLTWTQLSLAKSFRSPSAYVLVYPLEHIVHRLCWSSYHGVMYKKAGLKTLVQLHKTLKGTTGERLMEDEVTIINSVLDLKDKPVGAIMTPMADVFTMSADTVLDERMMDTLLSQGYSRIPVYAPENNRDFIGMLLVKILITYDPEDCLRVRDFALATLPETLPHTSCLDIINFFQEGKSHMVLVSDFPGTSTGALGVVTLEDVIEELIGEEIIDESDVFVDVHKAIRRLQPAPRSKFRNEFSDALTSESERESKAVNERSPLLSHDQLAKDPSGARSRTNSGVNGQTLHPAATFLARRKSSTASDATRDTLRPIAMRSGTSDLRQHLKHLGPSNAASKPRATKFTSVKIKPGVGTIPEGQATTLGADLPSRPTTSPSPARTSTESPSLLDGNVDGNAGPQASDGAAAVAANYSVAALSQRRLSSDNISASEASRIARENTDVASPGPDRRSTKSIHDDETFQLPEKIVVGSDSPAPPPPDEGKDNHEDEDDDRDGDTVGELETSARERQKPRRAARSGSITETTVDHNGMKKTVLETTSSEELHDDAAAGDGGSSGRASPSNSQANLLRKEARPLNHDSSGTDGKGSDAKPKNRRPRRRGWTMPTPSKEARQAEAQGERIDIVVGRTVTAASPVKNSQTWSSGKRIFVSIGEFITP